MEDIIHAVHRVLDALNVANVTDVVFDLVVVVLVTHIVLLFLVTAEYSDLFDVGVQKSLEHRITEATRTSGDQ